VPIVLAVVFSEIIPDAMVCLLGDVAEMLIGPGDSGHIVEDWEIMAGGGAVLQKTGMLSF